MKSGITIRAIATMLAAAGCLLSASTAANAAPSNTDGVRATYKGKSINLAESWSDAKACVVFSAQDVRCYATTAEAD
ncbi:hypothetical protein, partial [Actinoplanes xinjiangensis]|uniref:hypothetical protein n=1 Tax=Actinoplanes xinjiangensis TaxID=512350 RepID=UPI0034707D84